MLFSYEKIPKRMWRCKLLDLHLWEIIIISSVSISGYNRVFSALLYCNINTVRFFCSISCFFIECMATVWRTTMEYEWIFQCKWETKTRTNDKTPSMTGIRMDGREVGKIISDLTMECLFCPLHIFSLYQSAPVIQASTHPEKLRIKFDLFVEHIMLLFRYTYDSFRFLCFCYRT